MSIIVLQEKEKTVLQPKPKEGERMWKCELCKKEFDDETMAIEVRFGYVDSEQIKKDRGQYAAFTTENAWAPLCDDCAVAYIKGEKASP